MPFATWLKFALKEVKDQCLPWAAVFETKSLLSNDLYSSKQMPRLKLMTSVNSWANATCSGDMYHLQEISVKDLDALSPWMCRLCPVGNEAPLQLYCRHLKFLCVFCCKIDYFAMWIKIEALSWCTTSVQANTHKICRATTIPVLKLNKYQLNISFCP